MIQPEFASKVSESDAEKGVTFTINKGKAPKIRGYRDLRICTYKDVPT